MENLKILFTKKAYKEYLNLPLNYKSLVDKTLSNFVDGKQVDIKMIKGEKILFALESEFIDCYSIELHRIY